MISKSTFRLAAAAFAVAAFTASSAHAQGFDWRKIDPNYQSTWERISETGYLTTGCVIGQIPYWMKDKDSGDMKGWAVEAAKDMSKELPNAKNGFRCLPTTWGTAALQIQSGKIDLLYAMQATPIRATAITFAGPLYNHGFMMVNSKNFKARAWTDYNKEGVRIAVVQGTSTALVRRFVAPNATAVELPKSSEVPLAVISGRADSMITTVINGIVGKQKNPQMGDFVIPTPLFSFPAYVGVANEPDRRFSEFAHWWAEWKRLRGQIEGWIKEALVLSGVPADSIPDKLYF